jgi:hypothetical protein
MTMRFNEVTERLGAIVDAPGHRGHGLPMTVALPHMAKVRLWRAVYGGYSWVIVFEPGVPSWTEEQTRAHVGYTATYRRLEHNTSSQTIHIDGPRKSFADAENACKRVWRQIRAPN